MKVLAALSGGVDSTVAAAMMIRAGHAVTGIYLGLWGGEANSTSCSTADASAAQAAADELGIKLIRFDLTDRFQREIVDSYASSVRQGMTPSPCVDCNQSFKVEHLIAYAERFGFDKICTGHYVTNGHCIKRGLSHTNDQSYFLWKMTPEQCKWFEFPLGHQHKNVTYDNAKEWGLTASERKASTDLCFNPKGLCSDATPLVVIGDGVIPGSTVQPGELTVGQRKKLPVNGDGQGPHFVTDITANIVKIGRKKDLYVTTQPIEAPTWHCESRAGMVMVQCSSQGPSVIGEVKGGAIYFREPRRKIAPGQDIVFYDMSTDTIVLGGTHAR